MLPSGLKNWKKLPIANRAVFVLQLNLAFFCRYDCIKFSVVLSRTIPLRRRVSVETSAVNVVFGFGLKQMSWPEIFETFSPWKTSDGLHSKLLQGVVLWLTSASGKYWCHSYRNFTVPALKWVFTEACVSSKLPLF